MLRPESLDPYRDQVNEQRDRIPKLEKVVEANEVEEALGKAGDELEMLIDIVGNLKIEDATQTTRIIDDISAIYSVLNQVRSELTNHRKSLGACGGGRAVRCTGEVARPVGHQLFRPLHVSGEM